MYRFMRRPPSKKKKKSTETSGNIHHPLSHFSRDFPFSSKRLIKTSQFPRLASPQDTENLLEESDAKATADPELINVANQFVTEIITKAQVEATKKLPTGDKVRWFYPFLLLISIWFFSCSFFIQMCICLRSFSYQYFIVSEILWVFFLFQGCLPT